jgi:O-antigen ligase
MGNGLAGPGRLLASLTPPLDPPERSGTTRAVGIFLASELVLAIICYQFDLLVGLLLVGGLLYAALCWYSLPAAWLLGLAFVPLSQEIKFEAVRSALWIPTEPMIFTFLAVWLVRSVLRREIRIRQSPLVTVLVALWAVAVLSVVQSDYLALSAKAIASTTWLVVFAFLFPYQTQDVDGLMRNGALILVVAGALLSLYGLLYLATHGVSRPSGSAMGRPFFPEHGTYSTFLCFSLALSLALSLSSERRILRVVGAIGFGLGLLAIILSLARAAYLGLAGFLGVFAFYRLRRRALVPVLVALGVLGLALVSFGRFETGRFVGQYVQSIADPGELSNLGRINRWLAAWNMARAHPLLGVGYGAYADAYYSYRMLTFRSEDRFMRTGAHSEYLTALSEMGWIGFGMQMVLLVVLARAAHRAIGSPALAEYRWLALGAFAGLVSYLIHGLFNNYSNADKMALPFWFLVAAVAVLANRASELQVGAARAP